MSSNKLLSFAAAARTLPQFNGRPIHPSTLHRWAFRGVRGIRLTVQRIGRRLVVSPEALDAFTRALGALPPASRVVPNKPKVAARARGEAQRRADLARAAAVLDQAGV